MNDLVTNVTSMTLKEITDMLDVRHNNAMRTVNANPSQLQPRMVDFPILCV